MRGSCRIGHLHSLPFRSAAPPRAKHASSRAVALRSTLWRSAEAPELHLPASAGHFTASDWRAMGSLCDTQTIPICSSTRM